MQGKLISFEGLDGAGKTTQIELLGGWLTKRKIEHTATFEPGGTPLGHEIRNLLFHRPEIAITPMAEVLLFQADRAHHFATIVIPALTRGELVITDRCFDSTIAYQGYAQGLVWLDIEFLESISKIAMAGIAPDLTILLDIPAEYVAKRKTQDLSRYDSASLEFHKKLRAGFTARYMNDNERVKLVDATQSVEAVHKDIVRLVEALLQGDGGEIES